MTVSADPPKTARELANTSTGLVPSARQDASSACVACRLARRPRSKSASHSPLTAAARWKTSSASASASWAKPGSPRSPRTTATRESAARSGGAGTRSRSVSRDSARPAARDRQRPGRQQLTGQPRAQETRPPVTTTASRHPTCRMPGGGYRLGRLADVSPGQPVPDARRGLPAGPLGRRHRGSPCRMPGGYRPGRLAGISRRSRTISVSRACSTGSMTFMAACTAISGSPGTP